ncbi:MAG TPA: glycosyltransferase family 2 protein [Candidatus Binatia bacterium]|nr:glycosyltransferase family 2 protein [Candidatus Binatia bacterium]
MAAVDVSVLVPVYNNATTLPELIGRLLAVLEPLTPSFELVFVDDGSRDESLALLRERAAADARLRVFAMTRNFGSQAASCAALDLARGQRIVHIDADLENFPEDIPRVLEYLDEGYDFVCGYREARGGSWGRRLPSLLMNAWVRRQTGTDIRDVGCGLRGLTPGLIRDLAAEGEGRRLLTPVLLRRARRIAQVPVRHRPKAERGGHSFFSLLGISLDFFMHITRRPFLVSGVLSSAAFLAGLAMLVVGPRLPGLVLAGFAAIGVLLSLVGEYAQRIYQLGQGIPFYKLRDLDAEEPAPPAAARRSSTRL